MKNLLLILILTVVMTGCFTTYPKYQKNITDCGTIENPTDTIKNYLLSIKRNKPERVIYVNDTAFKYYNTTCFYKEIKYIRIGKKTKGFRPNYSIQIFTTLGYKAKRNIFYSRDKELTLNTLSALQCLSGIDLLTNKKIKLPDEDKFDKLRKLDQLYKASIISKEEFESEKKKILE